MFATVSVDMLAFCRPRMLEHDVSKKSFSSKWI
jgi:hypothetical protein